MSNVGKAVCKRFWTLLHAYFTWILPYSKNPSKEPINIKFKKLKYFIIKLNKSMKVEIHATGNEDLPHDTKCVFLPNHMSAYDPMIISAVLPDATTYLSKIENKKIPVVGRIISAMEGCFVDRNDLEKSLQAMIHIENDLKEQNKNWVIFPEGTRNKDPMAPLLEFHKGSFRTAMRTQVPIIPVALYGTHNCLKSKYKLKKYPVYVTFLKPITPEEYKDKTIDEIRDLVKDRVQVEENKLRKIYYKEIEGLFKSKRGLKKYQEEKILEKLAD